MSITNKKWPSKRAGEIDYRGIDWTNDLSVGETIAAQSYTVAAGGTVSVLAVTKTAGKSITIATLSGGTEGTTDTLVGSITTSTGRVLEVEMTLVIN